MIFRPWNQHLVYKVIRCGAVHNHREYVAVGVKPSVAATSQQPCKRESLFEIVIEMEGRLFVVVGGARARALHSGGSVSTSTLRWAWRFLAVAFHVVVGGRLVYRTPLVLSSSVGCFASANPTPRGQGGTLLRGVSSHPGRHDRYTISACCSSCGTDKQRRQSKQLHLERDSRFCDNPGIAMAHTTIVRPQQKTENGIRGVWTDSCDPKRVHTKRWKQHNGKDYCHSD